MYSSPMPTVGGYSFMRPDPPEPREEEPLLLEPEQPESEENSPLFEPSPPPPQEEYVPRTPPPRVTGSVAIHEPPDITVLPGMNQDFN